MRRILGDLGVTVRALTHTTERAARRRGARPFLPSLFVDRFVNMGSLDRSVFLRQLDGCRSFDDAAWAGHWRAAADEHIATADAALTRLGVPVVEQWLVGASAAGVADRVRPELEGAVDALIHGVTSASPDCVADDASIAVAALVKAMTYLFAASWPGWTPHRMDAYRDSRRVFDVLLHTFAPALGLDVELVDIDMGDDTISAYLVVPAEGRRLPVVLMTNGLEGSIQELARPALRHRPPDMAALLMEMPGTYSYTRPLSLDSERYYRAVLDVLSGHPRIDPDRIGMLGVSFGAYWSTRMAAVDHRIKAVVSNGGFYHRGFGAATVVGMPEILLTTLKRTVGVRSLSGLAHAMRSLSIRPLFKQISVPVLAVNGDHDTLASTQDTVDLARGAPRGELRLYPDDDHCAMGHYDQFIAEAVGWLQDAL